MKFNLAELPSRGILFDKEKYNEINIKKLGIAELSLLSQAVTNKNPDNLVEAVKSVIDVPLQSLTTGDFFFIMAFLRCNSYKRTPLKISWVCDGYWFHEKDSDVVIPADEARAIIEQPDSDESVRLFPKSCQTENEVVFTFDDLVKIYLPDEVSFDEELFAIPHAGLYAEYNRLSKDPAMAELLPAVQWIKNGRTLKQKLEWLKSQGDNDLDIFDQAAELHTKYTHGISNTLVGTCTKCHTRVGQQFGLSAETFFRTT